MELQAAAYDLKPLPGVARSCLGRSTMNARCYHARVNRRGSGPAAAILHHRSKRCLPIITRLITLKIFGIFCARHGTILNSQATAGYASLSPDLCPRQAASGVPRPWRSLTGCSRCAARGETAPWMPAGRLRLAARMACDAVSPRPSSQLHASSKQPCPHPCSPLSQTSKQVEGAGAMPPRIHDANELGMGPRAWCGAAAHRAPCLSLLPLAAPRSSRV